LVVVKKFKDKYSKKIFNVGDNFVADKKRTDELVKLGFLKAEAKPKKQGD